MAPGKLTVVVGLPGSGKSTLLKQLRCSVTGLSVEDFHANAIGDSKLVQHSRYYAALIEALRAGHDCIIADIAFCEPERMSALDSTIRGSVPNVSVEPIYFENAPDKCRENVRQRNRPGVQSDFAELDRLTLKYTIPSGIMPRLVYVCGTATQRSPNDGSDHHRNSHNASGDA